MREQDSGFGIRISGDQRRAVRHAAPYGPHASGGARSPFDRLRANGRGAAAMCALALALAAVPARGQQPPARAIDLVDPLIGTGGEGFGCGGLSPGPQVPFGMVRLGPDTGTARGRMPGRNFGGYHHRDTHVRVFSHTHTAGAGVLEYGNVGLMPAVDPSLDAFRGPGAPFSHERETARVGYYAVTLDDRDVRVELTAARHAALHRYTFPAGVTRRVLVDASAALAGRARHAAEVEIAPERGELSGWMDNKGGLSGRGFRLYFIVRVRAPVMGWALAADGRELPGGGGGGPVRPSTGSERTEDPGGRVPPTPAREPAGFPSKGGGGSGGGDDPRGGPDVPAGPSLTLPARPGPSLTLPARRAAARDVVARFDCEPGAEPLEVAVGISFIDAAQARRNLDEQIGDRGFDAVRAACETEWEAALGAIEIEGGSDRDRRIFTTALYHSLIAPSTFTEAGGRYRGFDGAVHDSEGWTYYSDMSLWDSFRTAHPLLALIAPARQQDMLRSLVAMDRQSGALPRWPLALADSGSMIGTHADVLFADGYLKGLRGFDAPAALAAMVRHATTPGHPAGRDALPEYLRLGYCPEDATGAGASKTLEYAYDDWAIANLAEALGEHETARVFRARQRNYRNVWDPETRFFRGRRADGAWVTPLRPTNVFDRQYVEGDAWHWRWFAPHEVPGLIELFGGPAPFVAELEAFFTNAVGRANTALPDAYYWHGNEPDLHAAYLFGPAGRPDLTQRWVRWVMETKYSDQPEGLDGNDDYGTLSAWYVFSALGFYPIAGSRAYWLGAPRFPRARLRMAGGAAEIRAPGAGPERPYARALRIDGRPHRGVVIDHAALAPASALVFEMSAEPPAAGPVEEPAPGAAPDEEF